MVMASINRDRVKNRIGALRLDRVVEAELRAPRDRMPSVDARRRVREIVLGDTLSGSVPHPQAAQGRGAQQNLLSDR